MITNLYVGVVGRMEDSGGGGQDDRSDSGVSSLRSAGSGDERSGSRSSALSTTPPPVSRKISEVSPASAVVTEFHLRQALEPFNTINIQMPDFEELVSLCLGSFDSSISLVFYFWLNKVIISLANTILIIIQVELQKKHNLA